MSEEYVSVIDLAQDSGKLKQSIFKIIKKLRINTVKRRSANSRGQEIAYVTAADRLRILEYIEEAKGDEVSNADDASLDKEQKGVFYLIQLEPEHDPLRVKFGFTVNINDRLRHHRCSAPFATVIKTWPSKLLWERTAMDCVSSDCSQVYTEVFKINTSIDSVISKLDQFFALMSGT